MSQLPITYTIDETLKLIKDRADTDADAANSFYLKVYRRPTQYGRTSEHQATFSGASVIHFAQPEAWVPSLFGGGDYELHAYDPTDPSKRVGGMLVHSFPGQRKDKPAYGAVMASSAWKGPKGLVFPNPDEPVVQAPRFGGMTVVAPQSDGSVPAAPVDPNHAAWQARDALSREKQALELQLAREQAERRAADEAAKLREERARDKAEADRQMQELKAQMAAAAAAKPGPTLIETLTAVAAVVAPIAKMFFDSSTESRRLEAERHKEASTAQQAILARLAEPKGMSPEMTMLIETMKSQSMAGGEMMSRMVDVMGAMNSMSTSMIETMAANLGGNEGNPIIDGVKDIIKAAASVQRGAETGARRQVQQMVQPPQLPQQMPPVQSQTMPPQHGAGATASGPQTPAAQVTHFSGPPANGGTGAAMPAYPVVPQGTTAAIEGMIRNHEPPGQVIDFLLGKIDTKDPDLLGSLDKHDGDVEALIADRLGAWAIVQENANYLDALAGSWQEKAGARGLLEDEPAEAADDQPEA